MMNWLIRRLESSRRSIFFKLLSGFVGISLFLLLITLFSVFIINQLGDNIRQVSDSQNNLNQANSLLNNMDDLSQTLDGMGRNLVAINGISQSAALTPGGVSPSMAAATPIADYRRQRQDIDKIISNINELQSSLTSNNQIKMNLEALSPITGQDFNNLFTRIEAVIQATTQDKAAETQALWLQTGPILAQTVNQIKDITTRVEKQVAEGKKVTDQLIQNANQTRVFSQWVLIILGSIVIICAILFGIALTYTFTRPVERLRQRLLSLAEGDLVTPLEVLNRDQFGELAATFNQSIARLGEALQRVQEQAVKVSSASAEIAAASRQSAQISADQAGAVAEATVTIEELSFTAQQIAEAATLVAQAAEQALAGASEGQETVKESILGINSLKMQVQEIAIKILALSERSQRVGHIIEQITGIADRTHLLALNAAIESAAAGESGKRFAVVAAEVKKLAENSRNATKEVQSVLSEIQGATNASVMATEQGMKDAEQGVGLAHRSGDANQTIIMMVERTAQLSNAISLATQQQRSASEQVVSSMRQLATVIQDGAASAKQSSSLAISLDEIANDLRLLSSQFKVDGSDKDDTSSSGADSSEPDLALADSEWVETSDSFSADGNNGSTPTGIPNFNPGSV